MHRYFFLNDLNFFVQGDTLKGNPRIIKFDPLELLGKGWTPPSPSFTSIVELQKKDQRFVRFRKQRPKPAKRICKEDNIHHITGMLAMIPTNEEELGNMLLHVVSGTRERNKYRGIHYLEFPLKDFVKDYIETKPPDKNGVYVASFKIIHKGRIIPKQDNSSMFPRTWSLERLQVEMIYAYKNKQPIDGTPRKYSSTTVSGIPVEIWLGEDGDFRTMYPIWQE